MGKEFEELTAGVKSFILKQPVFYVGTAPLSSEGLVNVSPKGLKVGQRFLKWLSIDFLSV